MFGRSAEKPGALLFCLALVKRLGRLVPGLQHHLGGLTHAHLVGFYRQGRF